MLRLRSLIAPSLVALGVTAGAQAPRVTPAGDPSVRDDSIYALALDPKQSPERTFLYLLDDGVIRYETDGRGSQTYRQVVQVLTPEGAKRWGEWRFDYTSPNQRLTINWIRVLDSAHHVTRAVQSHQQEARGSSADSLEGRVVRRLSIGGVIPGSIVDVSWTVEDLDRLIFPDYYVHWRLASSEQVRRSRFLVDVPLSSDVQIAEHHLTSSREETFVSGRHVLVWAGHDVKRPDPELFTPDSALGMSVVVAAPLRWTDVSKIYARYIVHHFTLETADARSVASLTAGAMSRQDTLARLARWARSDHPCPASAPAPGSFESRYRQCEDHTALFIGAARTLGFEAYPILVGIRSPVDISMPSVGQFDHVIAAVRRSEDSFEFVDVAAKRMPYGELPPFEQGKFGLLVRDDGTHDKLMLPELPISANRVKFSLVGEVTPAGIFKGRWSTSASGNMRTVLEMLSATGTIPDSTERERCAGSLTDSLMATSAVDTLPPAGHEEFSSVEHTAVHVCSGGIVREEGGIRMLELPLMNLADRRLVRTLEGRGRRTMPIDAEKVSGAFDFTEELRLTMPAGWRARLPANVQAVSAFGTYEATYAQIGHELRVIRRYAGARGVYPASGYGELLTWLRAKAADDVKLIIIDAGR